MSWSESWTGRTKHADSCPMSVPALKSVGVLGRNSSLAIIWLKVFSLVCGLLLKVLSVLAMALATRLKSLVGVSVMFSCSSRSRYLAFRTSRALTVSLGSMPRISLRFLSSSFLFLKSWYACATFSYPFSFRTVTTKSCTFSTDGVFSLNFSSKRLTTSRVTFWAFSPSPSSTARKAL